MAYTLIDEKRNIWGCRLGDLTFDIAMKYSAKFGPTRTLKDLNAQIEFNTGRIILNMDNSRYTQNRFNAIAFLEANKAEREAMIKSNPDDPFFKCMQEIVDAREALWIKEITRNYIVCDKNYEPNDFIIDRLVRSNPNAFHALYEYGFIQGKRAERTRRKAKNKQAEENKKAPATDQSAQGAN